MLTVLALALFVTIFFLASGGKMWRWFLNELPATMRESTHRAAGAGWYTFAGYARGTVLVALTDAVMAGIFLQLVGIPLAAPLAVLVFIGAFIPIIGAPLAMLVAMVVALASGGFVTMIVVGSGGWPGDRPDRGAHSPAADHGPSGLPRIRWWWSHRCRSGGPMPPACSARSSRYR